MPDLAQIALRYLQHFATLSMVLLLSSTIAFMYERRLLAALGFLAVGFGGGAVVWSRWSERAGAHNNFRVFLDVTGISFNEAFMLITHAPFILVGIAILMYYVARQERRP